MFFWSQTNFYFLHLPLREKFLVNNFQKCIIVLIPFLMNLSKNLMVKESKNLMVKESKNLMVKEYKNLCMEIFFYFRNFLFFCLHSNNF